MVFMVAADHEDVLGSSDLDREWDESKEKCETFERENFKDLSSLCRRK